MGTKATGRSLPLATDGQSAAAALLNYGWRGARLLEGFFRKRPIHCIVQVSNRCNLSCGFCSFWERPAPRHDEMTVADFETISAKLAEGGAMIVSIEGGEPLSARRHRRHRPRLRPLPPPDPVHQRLARDAGPGPRAVAGGPDRGRRVAGLRHAGAPRRPPRRDRDLRRGPAARSRSCATRRRRAAVRW